MVHPGYWYISGVYKALHYLFIRIKKDCQKISGYKLKNIGNEKHWNIRNLFTDHK